MALISAIASTEDEQLKILSDLAAELKVDSSGGQSYNAKITDKMVEIMNMLDIIEVESVMRNNRADGTVEVSVVMRGIVLGGGP